MSRMISKTLVLVAAVSMLLAGFADRADAQYEPLLGVTDPIPCGGQPFGTISGGVGPYSVSHVVAGVGTLGPFTVAAAGDWTAPAGYIDYSAVPAGNYSITAIVVDANGTTASSTFIASLSTACAPPVAGPGSASGASILAGIQANNAAHAAAAAAAACDASGAAAYVAKIEAIAKGNNTAQVKAALAAAKASAAAASGAACAKPVAVPAAAPAAQLAFTGNEVSLPVTAGAILIGSGGLLLLAANKRNRKDI